MKPSGGKKRVSVTKKSLIGTSLRERLYANDKARMYHFLLMDGAVRGAIVHGEKLVNEMRENHELGILETLVLGHAYMGALLMSSNLKGAERVSLGITCDGPIRGLSVDANTFGEVRGYLKHVPIPIVKPLESFNLAPFFGKGIMTITRQLEKAKQPFVSQIELKFGNMAQDLAYYATKSEQIPSAFDLSIKFDRDGLVTGAGGLLIQALPGADEQNLFELEQIIHWLPSLGESLAEGRGTDEFLIEEFADHTPQILESRRIEFMCHCSRERYAGFLKQLPVEDLQDMAENDPFPTVLTCHNCNTSYHFEQSELLESYREALGR